MEPRMPAIKQWIKQHKFKVQLVTFLLVTLPALGLYTAASQEQTAAQWALLGLVVLGNAAALLSD